MATQAQIWAQKRNYLKGRLKGAIHLFGSQHKDLITLNEKDKMDIIMEKLDQLLYEWDSNNAVSKKNYLESRRIKGNLL